MNNWLKSPFFKWQIKHVNIPIWSILSGIQIMAVTWLLNKENYGNLIIPVIECLAHSDHEQMSSIWMLAFTILG